jgi:hypothetical protein
MYNWIRLHSLYDGSMVLTIAKERETLHHDSPHDMLQIAR